MGESTGMPLQSARATNSLSPLTAAPAEASDGTNDAGKGFDRLLTSDAGPESETASHLHNGADGKPRSTDNAPPAGDASPDAAADTSLLSVLAQMPAAQHAPAPVAAAATAPALVVSRPAPTSALPAPGTAGNQATVLASSNASSTALPAALPSPAGTAVSPFNAALLATATPAAAQLPASSAAPVPAGTRQPAPAMPLVHPEVAAAGITPLRPALAADLLTRAAMPAEIPHPNPDGMAQWAAGRATQIVQPLAGDSAMPMAAAVPVTPFAASPLLAVAAPASPAQVLAATTTTPQAPMSPALPSAFPPAAAPIASATAEAIAAAVPAVTPIMARNDRPGSAAPQTILPPLLAPSPFPPSPGRPGKVDAPFSFPLADLPATPGLPASQRLPTGLALGDIETALALPRTGSARPAAQPLASVADPGGIPLQQAVPLTHGLLPTAPQPIAAAAAPPVLAQPADPSAGYDDRFSGHIAWMAGQRISQAEIRVSPEHLGNIAIRLQVEGNEVRAEFHSTQAEVRHALEASLPRLREMLSQHGLQLAQAGVGQGQAQSRKPSGNTAAAGAPETDQPLEDAAPSQTPVFRRGRGLLDVYA